MSSMAKIINLDENIEEEAVVQINDVEFVAFIAYAPYAVEVGQEYPVDINLFIDEINITESTDEIRCLVRNGDTFEYLITGYLNSEGVLDIGFLVEDDIFNDYQHFYGKYVSVKIDRINLEFF